MRFEPFPGPHSLLHSYTVTNRIQIERPSPWLLAVQLRYPASGPCLSRRPALAGGAGVGRRGISSFRPARSFARVQILVRDRSGAMVTPGVSGCRGGRPKPPFELGIQPSIENVGVPVAPAADGHRLRHATFGPVAQRPDTDFQNRCCSFTGDGLEGRYGVMLTIRVGRCRSSRPGPPFELGVQPPIEIIGMPEVPPANSHWFGHDTIGAPVFQRPDMDVQDFGGSFTVNRVEGRNRAHGRSKSWDRTCSEC